MITTSYCGRQEEPAILISRLLLRMRRMDETSIHLDLTKNERNAQNTIWSKDEKEREKKSEEDERKRREKGNGRSK